MSKQLAVAMVSLLVACGPAPAETVARVGAPIYNGEFDDGHPAVNTISDGGRGCSSTLVGRRTVLTAAHCLATPPLPISYSTSEQPGIIYKAVSAAVHFSYPADHYSPEHDVAVIRLDANVKGVIPALLSNTAPAFGEAITLVGFGIPGNSGIPGAKRKGVTKVSEVGTNTFQHQNGPSLPTTCSGDSGGAVFAQRGGEEVQIGVVSGGTTPCDATTGWGVHTRVDIHYSWIAQQAQGDLYAGQPIDIEPPKVSIASPKSGPLPPTFSVEVEASDNVGVTRVVLLVDQVQLAEATQPPYSFQIKDLRRGSSHDLEAVAYDAEELQSSAKLTVTIQPGAAFGGSCAQDVDCASKLCREGSCTKKCSPTETCPEGYSCLEGAAVCTPQVPQDQGCSLGAAHPPVFSLLALLVVLGLGATWLARVRRLDA
jgi:hypothetical protein